MSSRLLVFLSLFILPCFLFAQGGVNGFEIWPYYSVQAPVKGSWSATIDYSHRYNGLFDSKTQWIGRAGVIYKLNKQIALSAGYAYSEYFSTAGLRRENRPWQQIQSENTFKKFSLNNRLRLEERFQNDQKGDRFNYRLRCQLMASFALLKEQRLALNLSEELMLNIGKQITGNKFDQNRLQAGLQVKIIDNVFFTPAYLYTYQIQSNKKDFRNVDIVRTGIVYKR